MTVGLVSANLFRVCATDRVCRYVVVFSRVVADREGSCSNATDTFECLVNVDEGTLQNANVAINLSGFFGTFVLVPVIDGEFIIGSPSKQIESGRLNGVSIQHLVPWTDNLFCDVRRNVF